MSELNDFFKLMAEGKKNDPKAIQAKEIKENIKSDLGDLFSQMAEMKKQDPLYQKNKKLEEQIHESVQADIGSLFAELASLRNQKQEMIAENPELVDKPIEESVEQIAEEILIEVAPLNTPIGNIPVDQQLEPEKNPVVDMDSITKYLGSTETSKEEPKSTNTSQYDIDLINKKIKFIEQWVSKIQNAGPGSGEVNLRYLDDVDRSTIVDGYFLKYNDSTRKFDFASPTATSFNPTDIKAVYAEVKNGDSVTIHKGDPVYLYAATGNRASVILDGNLSDATSAKTMGLAYSDFAPGQTGIIITQGVLTGVDTSMYAEGDTLYLGATVGTLTNVKPYSPNHLVYIGVVERANQGQGQIYVRPQNGYELDEIHNVNINHINVLADGHYLKWSATDNQWVNAALPALFSGAYADLTGKPTLFSGSYTDLTNKPSLFSGAYADLTGKPTLFSGSYTDLTNKPTIPSLTGYATETFVNTAITNLIGAAPSALDTLKEIADQLAADESAVSSLTTAVSGKVSLSGSYADPTWITSLAYSKLTGAPSLATVATSGSYTDLTNKPTIYSSAYIGTTSLDFTRASGTQTLNGVSISGNAGTVTNGVYTTDTGTVTNAMLAGNIANAKLFNSTVTIGSTVVALGTTATNLEGLNLVSSTYLSGALNGNASTSTKLATARAINGVDFDGSSAITITAAADTLTGTTLKSTVVNSSLTSVGTLTGLTTSGAISVTYTPGSTTGSAITTTGKDTQGGTGYFDFFKATNTTSGVTNPNKTFRLNSTGFLEIINSAYSATLFSLSDTGNVSISGDYRVNGKKAVNGPSFRAYVATGQAITSGSQQKVTFGSESFDTDGCFTSSTFTPNVEGYYQLNATVRIDGPASTGECMIILYKNGQEYARGNNESGTEQGSSFYSMQVSDIAYANGTTDNFEIRIQQTSGSNRNTTAGSPISYFSGCMIRGA